MEDSSCPTENRCRKNSSRERSSLHRKECDPTAGARHEDAGKDLRRAIYSQSGCCQDRERNSQSPEHPVWDSKDHLSRFDQTCKRCRRKPNAPNVVKSCRVKETSRAKSVWSKEGHKMATVLSSNHQLKIPGHIPNRNQKMSRARNQSFNKVKIRLSEINKECLRRYQRRPWKPEGAKEFNKSEAEMIDVMDTFQHVISIIEM